MKLNHKKYQYYYSALLFLFLLSLNSTSQTYTFSNLSVKDGLSQSTVNAILQDKKGFMWFGTGDGLNRYDGHDFLTFKHNERDSNSIIDNSIRKILEDNYGHLWIGTDGGISEYTLEQKKFTNTPYSELKNTNLLVIEGTKVWFWKYNFGIGYIDIESRKIISFYTKKDTKSVLINASVFLPNYHELILATNFGLFHFNTTKYIYETKTKGLENIVCRSLNFSNKNQLYVGTDNNLLVLKYDNKSNKIDYKIQNSNTKFIVSIEVDLNGKIWLGSYKNGLFILDEKTKIIDQIIDQNLNSNLIKIIYKDQANSMWLGTDGIGLKQWSNYKIKFRSISIESDLKPKKLSGNFIKCFAETNDGKILVASLNNGINIFDPKTETNTVTNKFGKNIHKIYKDTYKNIWIIADQTIKKYNENFLKPHNINFPAKPYLFYPNCVFTDSKKNTWIGCSVGLYKVDSLLNTTFIEYSDSFSFHCVFEDSKHQLWFSTNEDVLQLNTDQSKLFKNKQLEKTNIRNITETDNTLWFSGNKGLFSYSLLNNTKVKYGILEGLSDLMIYGVITVNNCLWISSNNGLSKFNIKNKTFRNFHLNDGLQSIEFNSNSFFKTTNGWLYFGGINGFNYFDPNKIIDNPNNPKTVITNIKLFDLDLPINQEVSELNELILNHDQNILSFEFSSLEFTDVIKNKYAYKMEGIDTGWVNSNSRNFVRYANMEPGNYMFNVKSYNNDGIGNEKPTKIQIIILTPWWKSWWFKIIIFLLIIFSIYSVFKIILNKKLQAQKQINQRLIDIENERSRISKDMHDDLGSGLSKIAIISQLLKSNIANKSESEKVEKISQTAKDLVDSMGQIIWSMNPENIHLESLTSYIREYAIDFFEESTIECNIDFPDEINEIKLTQQQIRNVFLVTKETLNNTLKYSKANEVKLSLIIDKNKLKITIIDNGKGFDLTQSRRFGNGLINMKKRMDEISGFYHIESTLNAGTVTTIII